MIGSRTALTFLCFAYSAFAAVQKPLEEKWDVVKVAADGVRDPDPKYHPNIPPPIINLDPYENMEAQNPDIYFNEYVKHAMDSCKPDHWGHNAWWHGLAEKSKCQDFQRLDKPYRGLDTAFKHKCVDAYQKTLGDDPKNLHCSCGFNGWEIDCPCDFKLVREPAWKLLLGGPNQTNRMCMTKYNHAHVIKDSRKTLVKPPHYWNDADSHNSFNPYRMTPKERIDFGLDYSPNGTCFPRESPLHPLGQVDELTIKLAALETCEKVRRGSPAGGTKMTIPRLQNTDDRLFYNKDWITSIYWNTTDNKQYAVGVRFAVDWDSSYSYPNESLTMEFSRCKEVVYSTAQCGFNPSNNAKHIGSGVGLFFADPGHLLMVEVESRELFESERIVNPRRILPLKPQKGMVGAFETQLAPADQPLPTPVWESRPGDDGSKGVWITYIHAPLSTPGNFSSGGATTVHVYTSKSSVAQSNYTLVSSSNNASLAEASRLTSTTTPNTLQAAPSSHRPANVHVSTRIVNLFVTVTSTKQITAHTTELSSPPSTRTRTRTRSRLLNKPTVARNAAPAWLTATSEPQN